MGLPESLFFFKKLFQFSGIAFFFLSCGQPTAEEDHTISSLESLAWSDIAQLTNAHPSSSAQVFPEDRVRQYNSDYGGVFSKIFGGTSALHVQRFILERVRFFFGADVSSAQFFKETGAVRSGNRVASNEGTAFWLYSRATHAPIFFKIRGQKVPIDSTRVGIIKTELAYASLPYWMRVQTEIHEGRHSDCSERLYDADFQGFHAHSSMGDILGGLKKKGCGHLHVKCGSSLKALENIEACDGDPSQLGAYAISVLFLEAIQYEKCPPGISGAVCRRRTFSPERVDLTARLSPMTTLLAGKDWRDIPFVSHLAP